MADQVADHVDDSGEEPELRVAARSRRRSFDHPAYGRYARRLSVVAGLSEERTA